LDYPQDRYQVIVVDDQSDQSPESLIADFCQRIDVTLLVQPHRGPAVARNAGAALSTGDYVVFIDDDCVAAPDWLCCLAKSFAVKSDYALGGFVVNRLTENPYSAASQALVDFVCGYFQGSERSFFTSNNLAVPSKLFREIGGFDEQIALAAAEDREFCVRWLRLGHHLAFDSSAIVHHAHKLTLRRFWRQHFNYGRGAYYFRKIIHSSGREPVKLESLSFYSRLVFHPLSQGISFNSIQLSLLLMVSQVANLFGFFYETMSTSRHHFDESKVLSESGPAGTPSAAESC